MSKTQSVLPEQRLIDLVRYCRHDLYTEGLITDDEYAALVEVGADAARRLESYDSLRLKLREAEAREKDHIKTIADLTSQLKLWLLKATSSQTYNQSSEAA